MTPLSASEAISPAIEHTKALLRPFSLKLWLKLGLVALLAEAGAQLIFPPVGQPSHSSSSGAGAIAGGITSAMVPFLIVFGVIAFLVGLALFYLASRMQLVLMDIVATRTTLVAPVWHRTASRTWRWIGFKVATFLAIFIVAGAVLVAPLIYFLRSMPRDNAQSPAPAFFGSFALIFLLVFAVFFIILLAIWSMRDFVLPFLLFEDATIGDAIRNAWALIRREPGSFLFYLIMKFLLTLVTGIAAEFCIVICLLLLGLPLGGVGAALWFMLHQAGPFGSAMMYVSFALLGLIFLVTFIGAIICILCAVLIFYQAYTLYFLGGRIPVIGNLLQPPRTEPPPLGSPLAPALS
jgi:hypothetical protein